MPAPRNPKEVKQFLGLVGYYRKFVPRFADISRVLTHLTKKDVEFKWMPECENCFQILKEFLQQAPILRYPDPQASYTLYTNALKYAYAGVFTQHNNGTDHPITYISGLFHGSRLGLLGKNQVEVKDNHGHITKVHHRDVKKIPMTEKVCKLYEEEQTEKTREGRKAVPTSKMPDLGWDIAETQLIQEVQKESSPNMTLPLQTLITIIILIIAIGRQMTTQTKEIAKKAVQATENMIKKANHNNILRNIKDFHRTTMLAITIATNMTDRTNHSGQAQINNRSTQNPPGTRKPNDEYDESYQSCTSRTHSYYNS